MQGYNDGSSSYTSPTYTHLGADSHETGTYPSIIMFTRHFHAYATCLHEFMTVLKAKDLYDQTLIHTSSDFNYLRKLKMMHRW